MTVTITFHADLRVPDRDGRLQPKGDRLAIIAPFGLKDAIKALPTALWAPAPQKFWHVAATPEIAGEIIDLLDRRELGARMDEPTLELVGRVEAARGAQAHKVADILPEIPGRYCTCPAGPTLHDDSQNICEVCHLAASSWLHQRQGYHWAHPRLGAGLFMDMGTAKSKVAIALAEGWHATNMIVVAPPKAVRVWPKQFRLHGQRDWIVSNHGGIGRDGKPRLKASMVQRVEQATKLEHQAQLVGQPFAMVVNYEAAWQEPMRSWILDRQWGVGVADESHKIKSPGGKWSKFMEQLSHRCEHRLALTGTPMPHDETDVYAQARFLDPGVFGTSWRRFIAEYFEMGGFEGRQIQGFLSDAARARFLEKLAGMSFVVESDDVLDLPPQMDQPATAVILGDQARKHYRELVEEWQTEIGDSPEDEPLVVRNALSQMVRLSQVTSGHLPHDVWTDDGLRPPSYEREIVTVGREKATALADILDDLAVSEPVVVFARFVHDLDEIRAVAEAAGRRYREVSGRRGDGLDEDGKMVADCDLVGVQLQAGGTGVDLTRARYCVYYSLDFNLGDYDQTRKRVHRPGQKRTVYYYFLVADQTIDVTIRYALKTRAAVIGGVIKAIKTGDYGDLEEIE